MIIFAELKFMRYEKIFFCFVMLFLLDVFI